MEKIDIFFQKFVAVIEFLLVWNKACKKEKP